MPAGRFGLLVVLVLGASACHTYTPVQTPALGTTVRVQVPVANALRGPNEAPATASVEGEVVAVGDTLALAVQNRQEYGAYREVVQYDTLRLGMDQAALLEVREFSTQKSVLLGAVIAAGATVAAIAAFNSGGNGSGGNEGGEGPGPTPAIVFSPSMVSMILGLFGG